MYINLKGMKLSQTNVNPDDVFMVKMDFSKYDAKMAYEIHRVFKYCFPDNNCMIIPHDCDVKLIKQIEDDFSAATQEELFTFLNIKN